MRANTSALLAIPEHSLQTNPKGAKYHLLKFPSILSAHAAVISHARTENESSWKVPSFIGLNGQTLSDLDKTSRSIYAQQCLESSIAAMTTPAKKPGEVRNTVTGGFWDIPSVIAGLPLAARSRVRTKLPPINLKLWIAYSGCTNEKDIAPLTAKIAKALWDYIKAGGIANLSIITGCRIRNDNAETAIIETRVNTSDISALALALSPVYMRTISAALLCALSDKPHDSLPLIKEDFLPGLIPLSNFSGSLKAGAERALAALKIA